MRSWRGLQLIDQSERGKTPDSELAQQTDHMAEQRKVPTLNGMQLVQIAVGNHRIAKMYSDGWEKHVVFTA